MVTITRQVFTNIFKTEHFSAVKFAIGYDKNMSYTKISKSFKKKGVEKIGLGPFKCMSWGKINTKLKKEAVLTEIYLKD